MKHHNTLEAIRKERAAFYVSEHPSEESPVPESGPRDLTPRDATQAERAAMHPDHQDLEWPYCRGGWIG